MSFRIERDRGQWELSWKWTRILEFAGPRFSLGLCLFEDHWSLNVFGLWIRGGKAWRAKHPNSIIESWGFSSCDRSVHLNWGHRTKIVHMPWDWGTNIRHEVLDASGKLVKAPDWREPEVAHKETHPYRYVLKNGTVQDRLATISVEEREWRWRWLKWSRWPRIVRRSIDVQFDAEVGERSGSWKGGCTGCSYEMLPGETPMQTLRRMERERKFT